MRILNWMKTKLNGRQEKKRSDSTSASAHHTPDARKEEFNDWPQTLLAIGTFGNNNDMKEDPSRRHELSKKSQSSQDLHDFTSEEVIKLQKELTKLLAPSIGGSERGEQANLPLNRFLNCKTSLEVDRTTCLQICHNLGNNDDGDLSTVAKIILNKAKDMLADNKSGIRRRSLSFLLKKMIVCHSGFAPSPSLKDPLPESSKEKILRAIIHKKIYPQSSAQPSTKKYLEKSRVEEEEEQGEDGSKWDKTDSEYIVLEI